MEPIGVWSRAKREWALIHRCTKCGIIKANRIAGDDNEMALFAIAARPMTEMPFPSDSVFEKMNKELTV
jgi:RNHCP domain-containing protein